MYQHYDRSLDTSSSQITLIYLSCDIDALVRAIDIVYRTDDFSACSPQRDSFPLKRGTTATSLAIADINGVR